MHPTVLHGDKKSVQLVMNLSRRGILENMRTVLWCNFLIKSVLEFGRPSNWFEAVQSDITKMQAVINELHLRFFTYTLEISLHLRKCCFHQITSF